MKSETVISWHRKGFELFWTWKSRNQGGRPRVDVTIGRLIGQMGNENATCGAPRIHGVRGSVSTAAGLWGVSTAFIRLTRPGAQVVAEVHLSQTQDDCEPWPECWMMGPEPISALGVLPPGTYTLEAGATGDAHGYAKFGLGDLAFCDFDREFALGPLGPDSSAPIPALSNGGLAVLGMSLVCAARWLARRERLANA